MLVPRLLPCFFVAVLITGTLPSAACQAPAFQAPGQASPAPKPIDPAPGAQSSGIAATRDSSGTYTIRRTARLVVLDVVVTDAKGNIVPGLTRDKFHVTEAKEPQTVLDFTPPGVNMPPPEATIDSTADLDRVAPRAPVNIILLDEFNTRFEDEAFARYSLKKYLERQPEKLSVPTELIAVDLQHFSVLHDYTDNKAAILRALDHHFVAYPWQQRGISWVPERYATAFETLRRVAEATMGHPGHKNMIWIGRGFPSLNGSLFTIDTETRINNEVQQCVDVLRDARVTLYTVDPAGISAESQVSLFSDYQDQVFGGNYQFSKLAVATGGHAFYGRNDVDAEIGTSARDGANFYTLTYRPTTASLDPQKFRRISVAIDQPGAKVTTREGYFVELPPARVNAQTPSRRLSVDLLAANNSNLVYDGVPLTLTPVPNEPDSFNIHVDGSGLAWSLPTETEPRRAEVILLATSFDKKGKELHRISRMIRAAATGADVPPTGRLERSLNIITKLDHDPKAVRARFVVRVTASGRIGTVDTALPAPAAAAPAARQPQRPLSAPPPQLN